MNLIAKLMQGLTSTGTHRRTPETWAAMAAALDAKDARIEALQRRVSLVADSDAQITRLVAERDALALRVRDLEHRLASDGTATQELPIPGRVVAAARFQQGARAARGAA